MSLGFTEILLIVVFVLLVFGSKRIPELARSLGRASYEFKKAKEAISNEGKEFLDEAEASAKAEDKKNAAKEEPKAGADAENR